jgi:hypothetical protein
MLAATPSYDDVTRRVWGAEQVEVGKLPIMGVLM